jgi:hypothetical protein
MKRISYCGESFLTTDGAADALLMLVVALPQGYNSEMLEVPAVGDDGNTMIVQLVVGPTSELISIPEETRSGEPDTAEVVAYLRDRLDALAAPREYAYSAALASAEYDWDDAYLL